MNNLEQLEKELHIFYPKIYKQLYENGMLNWGENSEDWFEETLPTLKSNPPLLLFGDDFQILNLEHIPFMANEIKNDIAEGKMSKKHQFIPFATSESNDLYVFQYDLASQNNVPISYLYHDDNLGIVLAKNLQDFIFRMLLEAVTDLHEEGLYFEEDKEDLKQNLIHQLRTHQPYLTPHQFEILEEIYARDIVDYTYKLPNGREDQAEGLATFDEVEKILKAEIDFEFLNKEFDYTSDEDN